MAQTRSHWPLKTERNEKNVNNQEQPEKQLNQQQQQQQKKTREQRADDILEILPKLRHLHGFPTAEVSLNAVAYALASFIETSEVNHHFPDEPNHPLALGYVVPLEWVTDQVLQTCDRFPAPIRWRQIYEGRFVPLDHRFASDLLSVVEGQ